MGEDGDKHGVEAEKGNESSFPTRSEVSSIQEIGTEIGPYKLLSVLGEGGFGIVYLAAQRKPVRRQVAVKVIKPGMDSKQVIARFEAERQALALLDHPNIARVLDGGTTDAGRPYFVLELVKGLPITQYCDHHKLSIEERLELFRQVCEAVQHAHQKGIIHRDIKPSNILVPERGGKPVPLIIDFGVAKAVSQPLTERTLFTEQGQFVGTPEYMSPEQAGLTIEDIDTRSDIYSLGVLLYELLTGTLPFSHDELARAGFAEIQRIIRETEPPRPSTRLSGLGDEAKKIAERRRTEIGTLTKRVHKELEWIPLKAMRKEPDRRYRTALELAEDVRNYLNGDPLIAGPESLAYRARKFTRKYAGPLVSAAVIFVVLLAGLVVSTAMYISADRAHRQEAVAREEADRLRTEEARQRRAAEEERDKAREAEGLAEQRRNEAVAARDEAERQTEIAQAVASLLKSANKIDISGSSASHVDLEHLSGSESLRSLWVPYTSVADTDLVNVENLTALEGLFLGGTQITDAGLAHVKDLTSLRSLCVHETEVGDAGLIFLKGLQSLRSLCLADTTVTDAGLVHLKGLTSLADLKLQGTQVTEAGISELRAALPNCRILGPNASAASRAQPGMPKVSLPPGGFQIPAENLSIPQEMQACAANLQKIHVAIKKYEAENGELPQWLSQLVPKYLAKELLLCPNNPDQTRARHYPDPNLPCAYNYEFAPMRRGNSDVRSWKEKEVEEFGDVVPIVRCLYHGNDRILNVSIGGEVYWGQLWWELIFDPSYFSVQPDAASAEADVSLAGKVAPSFTLQDIDGQQVSLSDFRGKVVLLDFWATWCAPCRRAIPHLEALHKKYKGQGLVVIGMNHEKDYTKVKDFAAEQISYLVLIDADEQFKDYGISGIPAAFYVDRRGTVQYEETGFGPGDELEMEQRIQALLADEVSTESGPAETSIPKFQIPADYLSIPQDMQACAANLQKVQAAIKAYERDKGDLPRWLSDVVPDYLSKELLLCPSNPDRLKSTYYPDPCLPCAYSYEFAATFSGNRDIRQWKRRELEEFGEVVPMVRCMGHGREAILNVSVGGQIYWGDLSWELMFNPNYYDARQSSTVPEAAPSLVGKPLPELGQVGIELPDEAEGRMLLVCFWDMNQRPSRYLVTQLARQAVQLSEQGVTIVAVHAASVEQDALHQWAKENEISFLVGSVTGDSDIMRSAWTVRSLPYLILTDPEHTVVAEGFSLNELDQKIEGASGQ